MTNPTAIKETVPKAGLLFQEITLHPVLCKPKIMPLKSVTLEKLEKMQKEAQEKVMEMERKQERPSTGISRPKTGAKKIEADEDNTLQDTTRPVSGKKDRKADVWRADEDGQSADEAGQD